jgi:hypothetical protein
VLVKLSINARPKSKLEDLKPGRIGVFLGGERWNMKLGYF